jgi:hypothetical protein
LIQQRFHLTHSDRKESEAKFEKMNSIYNWDYVIDLAEMQNGLWKEKVDVCLWSGLRYLDYGFFLNEGYWASVILKVRDEEHENTVKSILKRKLTPYAQKHKWKAGWKSHDDAME